MRKIFMCVLMTLTLLNVAAPDLSVFADEKRLREDISDVYLAVTGQEARPNNLLIERVKFLQTELRKSSDKLVSLNQQYNDRVMAIFKKEKIDLEKP